MALETMTDGKHQIGDAEYAAALAAGRAEADMEIRAQTVRYLPEQDALEIVTTRGAGFVIPRSWIGAIDEVSPEELRAVDLVARRLGYQAGPGYPHQCSRSDDCCAASNAAGTRTGVNLCKPWRQGDDCGEAAEREARGAGQG